VDFTRFRRPAGRVLSVSGSRRLVGRLAGARPNCSQPSASFLAIRAGNTQVVASSPNRGRTGARGRACGLATSTCWARSRFTTKARIFPARCHRGSDDRRRGRDRHKHRASAADLRMFRDRGTIDIVRLQQDSSIAASSRRRHGGRKQLRGSAPASASRAACSAGGAESSSGPQRSARVPDRTRIMNMPTVFDDRAQVLSPGGKT